MSRKPVKIFGVLGDPLSWIQGFIIGLVVYAVISKYQHLTGRQKFALKAFPLLGAFMGTCLIPGLLAYYYLGVYGLVLVATATTTVVGQVRWFNDGYSDHGGRTLSMKLYDLMVERWYPKDE